MGFHVMAFDASRRTSLWSGDEVRRSYIMIERSIPVDAKIEVSVWLKAIDVMVSILVGQLRVWEAVEEGRERS